MMLVEKIMELARLVGFMGLGGGGPKKLYINLASHSRVWSTELLEYSYTFPYLIISEVNCGIVVTDYDELVA